jgi:hypothetical protein
MIDLAAIDAGAASEVIPPAGGSVVSLNRAGDKTGGDDEIHTEHFRIS